MKISFQKGCWDETELTHAYTHRFPYTNQFIQREDCIENPQNPAMADGFDYLSVMTRKPYPLGTRITTQCSFTGMAAPLLIFSEDLELCEDGAYRYGNYFEVVLYKHGINVWRLWRTEDGAVGGAVGTVEGLVVGNAVGTVVVPGGVKVVVEVPSGFRVVVT